MDKYQAPPPPFLERILFNVPLQIGLALVLVSGMGLYVFNKNPFESDSSQKQSRMSLKFVPSKSIPGAEPSSPAEMEIAPNSADSEASGESAPAELSSTSLASIKSRNSDLGDGEESANPAQVTASSERSPANAQAGKEAAPSSAFSRPRFRISIYEMQTFFRDELITASGAQGLFQRESLFPSGVLPQAQIAAGSIGRNSSLVFSEQKVLSNETPHWKTLFAHQVPNGGPTLGLAFEVFFEKSSAKSVTLSLVISRQWFTSLDGVIALDQPLELEQSLELEKDQGFIAVNLFPAQTLPGEKSLLNTSLAKIVSSTAFKSRMTDFVLVIDMVNASN